MTSLLSCVLPVQGDRTVFGGQHMRGEWTQDSAQGRIILQPPVRSSTCLTPDYCGDRGLSCRKLYEGQEKTCLESPI